MKKYYENEFETNYEEMSYISANYFTFINLRLGCSAMFRYFDKFDKILILCTQINVKSIRKKMMLIEDNPPANQAEFYDHIW